eukprot:1700536-Pyramimonas_sp.AAC.1
MVVFLVIPPAMLGVSVMRGRAHETLSAHVGHPSPPEGGLVIEPSGCRGIVGSSRSEPLAPVISTVEK